MNNKNPLRRFVAVFATFLILLVVNFVVTSATSVSSSPFFVVAIVSLMVALVYLQLRVDHAIPPLFGIGLNTRKLAEKIVPEQKRHMMWWWEWRAEELYNDIRSSGASHQYALECCYIAERDVVSHSEFRALAASMYARSASPTRYALARQQNLGSDMALLVATGELEMDLALVL